MRKAWLLILLSLLISKAFAIKVDALYQTTVRVNSQSAEERNKVIPIALEQVLIKASGNTQILSNPYIKSHLISADTLVQEFSYSATKVPGIKTPYLLQIHFDVNGVNQWLRNANAPVWGQNRPLIMNWILFESPNKPPEIIQHQSLHPITQLINQYADQRGIPIVLPAMDVADFKLVGIEDLKTLSTVKPTQASNRYGSDAILIGHVVQEPQGFKTQWKLSLGDDQWQWDLTGNTLAEIIPTVINKVADTLSARFAILTTNVIQKDIALKIVGITEQNDFAQLVRYLNHLAPVADVSIVRISGNEIFLNISLRSSQESFIQTIALGEKLTPVGNQANTSPLIYQWKHE